jgi:hypothetical protein
MNTAPEVLRKGGGLCLVDVQNDFCPGGTRHRSAKGGCLFGRTSHSAKDSIFFIREG